MILTALGLSMNCVNTELHMQPGPKHVGGQEGAGNGLAGSGPQKEIVGV